MARPKNDELKEKIRRETWALFRERGYTATSYTLIAEACGISRNLAQYHFPKKEMLAIELMNRVLDQATLGLGECAQATKTERDFAVMHAIGTCFFEFFLRDERWHAFLLDIIDSRELTESVLAFNAQWAIEHAGPRAATEVPEKVMRAVVVQMGGFYELLYYCLKNGIDIDVGHELLDVIRAFMRALEYDDACIDEVLGRNAASSEDIRAAVEFMGTKLP